MSMSLPNHIEPTGISESTTASAEQVLSNDGPITRRIVEFVTPSGNEDKLNFYLPSHLGDFPVEVNAVTLYKGPVILRTNVGIIEGDGEVKFVFSPDVSVTFFVHSNAVPFVFGMINDEDLSTALELPLIKQTVDVKILGSHSSTNGDFWARGQIKDGGTSFTALRPDGKPEPIGRVRFHLLNFYNFMGEKLIALTNVSDTVWLGRGCAEFGEWVLVLDALPDIGQRHKHLEEHGGCLVTHLGDLRRRDGKLFSSMQAEDVLEFLHWLLSFINGARCGCELAAGFRYMNEPLWEQWRPQATDTGKLGSNWLPKYQINEALLIAQRAWDLWRDKDKRGWIRRAVAIYTDCNKNSSGTEIELAKAQIALELLTWVVLREEQSVISEKGLKDLEAADRLRLLLSWCKVPTAIPPELTNLTAAVVGKNDADGPFVLTEIRNCAIHPTKGNLQKLNSYSLYARFEAWWLSLWYVEMVLLKVFNYDGLYDNRLKLGGWSGAAETVPWVTPKRKVPNFE